MENQGMEPHREPGNESMGNQGTEPHRKSGNGVPQNKALWRTREWSPMEKQSPKESQGMEPHRKSGIKAP